MYHVHNFFTIITDHGISTRLGYATDFLYSLEQGMVLCNPQHIDMCKSTMLILSMYLDLRLSLLTQLLSVSRISVKKKCWILDETSLLKNLFKVFPTYINFPKFVLQYRKSHFPPNANIHDISIRILRLRAMTSSNSKLAVDHSNKQF